MRYWCQVAVLVMLASACGGGTSSDDTAGLGVSADNVTESEGDESNKDVITFASDDGVVSVEVPPGAVPDDFAGTISKADLSDLGVDTSDSENILLVYELGPDGTEFEELVTITFRVPPALGDFDPSLGLPLSLVIIEDGSGSFEPLGSMRSFLEGDVLIVEGTTSHFSRAAIRVNKGQIELVVDPPGLTKSVESLFDVRVAESGRLKGDSIGHIDYSAGHPIEVFSIDGDEATMECREEGEGTIQARVFGLENQLGGGFEFLAVRLVGDIDYFGELSLKIECVSPSDPWAAVGELTFSDPGELPVVAYRAMVEMTGQMGASAFMVILTQQPGSQVTMGMTGPSGQTVILVGGDGSSYDEVYLLQLWFVGKKVVVLGWTGGGKPGLAERFDEIVQELIFTDVVEGTLVPAPLGDPPTVVPSDEEGREMASAMLREQGDPAGLGLDWWYLVYGVLDLSGGSNENG